MNTLNNVFGRVVENGVILLDRETGETVTRLDASNIYPLNSQFSVQYEHPEGIILSVGDCLKLNIEVEQ